MSQPKQTMYEMVMLGRALCNSDGSVSRPRCCGQPMADDGDCGQGCCDDYKCETCGKQLRVEWPA